MNSKGFTLIELIAVIVLIAIVGLTASLAIGNYTSYGFSSINDQLDKQLVLSAKICESLDQHSLLINPPKL